MCRESILVEISKIREDVRDQLATNVGDLKKVVTQMRAEDREVFGGEVQAMQKKITETIELTSSTIQSQVGRESKASFLHL